MWDVGFRGAFFPHGRSSTGPARDIGRADTRLEPTEATEDRRRARSEPDDPLPDDRLRPPPAAPRFSSARSIQLAVPPAATA